MLLLYIMFFVPFPLIYHQINLPCCLQAHSFALIMSEEETRYLAYLEDMYEDKKGQKKVKVRWFHQNREFACPIPPPAPHPSEVFITPYSQVIYFLGLLLLNDLTDRVVHRVQFNLL